MLNAPSHHALTADALSNLLLPALFTYAIQESAFPFCPHTILLTTAHTCPRCVLPLQFREIGSIAFGVPLNESTGSTSKLLTVQQHLMPHVLACSVVSSILTAVLVLQSHSSRISWRACQWVSASLLIYGQPHAGALAVGTRTIS